MGEDATGARVRSARASSALKSSVTAATRRPVRHGNVLAPGHETYEKRNVFSFRRSLLPLCGPLLPDRPGWRSHSPPAAAIAAAAGRPRHRRMAATRQRTPGRAVGRAVGRVGAQGRVADPRRGSSSGSGSSSSSGSGSDGGEVGGDAANAADGAQAEASAPPGGRQVLVWVPTYLNNFAQNIMSVTTTTPKAFTEVSPDFYTMATSGTPTISGTTFDGLSIAQVATQVHGAGMKLIPLVYGGSTDTLRPSSLTPVRRAPLSPGW